MNMGWQRTRRIIREWALLLSGLVLLHLLLVVVWVMLNPSRGTPLTLIVALMTVYLVALTIILLGFYRRLQRATWPPEFRLAREQGIPSTAYVLEVAPTGWRSTQGSATSFTWRPVKREYQLRLRVSAHPADDYEVIVAEYLRATQVPKAGTTIPVKVHPRDPQVVVLPEAIA